ncbi:MAG: tol-pal system protein YbgF [Desulfovibrionaceae bacterium]|nr:tol-pal system protein YbgF [Desulfovibrionaceae bacterium]MBF0514818.1 tol-pal system protein YbgF [Desulfovibrionaceae bacterium]
MNAKRFLAALAVALAAFGLCSCASPRQEIAPEMAQQANIQADVDALKQQTQRLRGEIEDIKYQLSAIGDEGGLKEMSARVQKLEANVNAMASQLAVDLGGNASQAGQQTSSTGSAGLAGSAEPDVQAAAAQIAGPAASSAASSVRADEPAEALYAKAMKAFESRNYAQARSLWGEFVKDYSKHPLAGNAWFWEGEAYYQMNDFANAALAYNEVITKFPKNIKVPSAYLKQGSSFGKLGNKKAGDLVLQDLIKKFPDTAEAKRAKALLAGK